jgi:hypothetical protein
MRRVLPTILCGIVMLSGTTAEAPEAKRLHPTVMAAEPTVAEIDADDIGAIGAALLISLEWSLR